MNIVKFAYISRQTNNHVFSHTLTSFWHDSNVQSYYDDTTYELEL